MDIVDPRHIDAPTSDGIQLRLLGRPQCLNSRTGQWHDLAPKAAALLALLALRGPTPRLTLSALLWPDTDGDKPRNSLRRLLSDLRTLAGAELFTGVEVIALAPGLGHDLDTSPASPDLLLDLCDYSELEEFQHWLDQARERRLQRALHRLGLRADEMQSQARWAEVVHLSEQMLALAPHDESACRRLMHAHTASGAPGSAMGAFERFKAELLREQGLAPSQATADLALLIELNEPLPAEPGRTTAAALAPLKVVGREQVYRALVDGWAAQQTVLLEGEAGLGKSVLLRQLENSDEAYLLSVARHGDSDVPFASLKRLLRALLARWRPRFEPQVRQELARLLHELGPRSEAQAHLPVLLLALESAWLAWRPLGLRGVIIDDLQWADDVSAKLMLALASRPAGGRWMFSCRTGMRPAGLQAALDDAPGRWQVLPLEPLDVDDVAKFLAALPVAASQAVAWARALCPRCLGNPLHLTEIVRALLHAKGPTVLCLPPPDDQPVPAGLPELLTGRLERLPDMEKYLAQLAALAGSLLSVRMACEVTDLHELAVGKAWASLEQQGILSDGVLGHDLLRQPLLDCLPGQVAQEMHVRIAELATKGHAPWAEIARHWRLAECWAPAAGAYEHAAREALALSVRDKELQLWDLAIDCLDRAYADRASYAARLQAFEAALVVHPAAEVELRVDALLALAETAADQVEAHTALARLKASQYQWAPALAAAERAVALAEAETSPQIRPLRRSEAAVRAACVMASALAASGRAEQAIHGLQALELELAGDERRLLRLHFDGTAGHVYGLAERFVEARLAYERAAGLAEELQDYAEAMALRSNLATILSKRGDLTAARDNAERAQRWAVKVGEAGSILGASVEMALGSLQVRFGEFGEGLRRLHAAHADMQRNQSAPLVLFTEHHLALAYMDLGQAAMARQALATPWAAVPPGRRAMRAFVERLLERLEHSGAVEAAPDEALSARLEALAGEPLVARLTLELACTPDLPPSIAMARCRRVATQAAAAGALATECSAWLHEAHACHRAGEMEQAAALMRRLLDGLASCMPGAVYLPSLWWLAYRVFLAIDDLDAAHHALSSGRDWVLKRARPHVPPEYQAGFLHNNPVNRQLLAVDGPRSR